MIKKHTRAVREVVRTDIGVWVYAGSRQESVARAIAIDVMRELAMPVDDFKIRDRIIVAIADRVDAVLDATSLSSIGYVAQKGVSYEQTNTQDK